VFSTTKYFFPQNYTGYPHLGVAFQQVLGIEDTRFTRDLKDFLSTDVENYTKTPSFLPLAKFNMDEMESFKLNVNFLVVGRIR